MTRPSVLCPVDFSDASRGALRYAAALAEHFYADLTVLTVNDHLLNDLAVFVQQTLADHPPLVPSIHLDTANGLPATEILRVASETRPDVIVMSTHGARRPRTMLGSVTARVLGEARVPVVIAPATDPGPDSLESWKASLKRVLVPVDFSPWTARQVAIARGLGEAVGTGLLFLHVLDDADPNRRAAAQAQLERVIASIPPALRPVMLLAVGDPATEIARVARAQAADVIVMGLHTTADRRQGMGHVTYSVLCQTPTLVVAWPPSVGRPQSAVASHQSPVQADIGPQQSVVTNH